MTLSEQAVDRVGRYLLLDSLGKGGMGEVYRARSLAAAGVVKELCVKRITPERLQSETAVQRFIAEARVAAMMSHSNVVAVFDFGRSGDEFFLAMEWIDGVDLRAAIKSASREAKRFAMHEAAYIAGCVARALAYAHGMEGGGVVHGDLKPANVLLSKDGNVKLTDFGAAATAGSSIVAGTPEYMAPESGKGSTLHPESDLFALGVMIKEMLCLDRLASVQTATTQDDPWADDRCREAMASLLAEMTAEDVSLRAHAARDVASRLEAIASYGRASGAPAPVDAVAQRVANQRAESSRTANETVRGTLDADVSFARDGLDEFATRMTLPTLDAPSMEATPNQTAPRTATAAARPGEAAKQAMSRRSEVGTHDQAGIGTNGVAKLMAAFALTVAALILVAAPWRDPEPPVPKTAPPTSAEVAVEPSEEPERDGPADQTAPDGREGGLTSRALVRAEPPSEAIAPERHSATAKIDSPRVRRPLPGSRPSVDPRPSAKTPKAQGTVHINALPWAEVFVDGESVGTTPLLHHRLPVGAHQITLVNKPLGARQEQRVEVVEDAEQRVIIDLRSQ